MAGRPWQPSTSINQLTSPPDPLLSKCRRSRHTKFQHNSRRCHIMPVASIYGVPGVLLVNQSFPAKSLPEFIAYALAKPGEINFASAGIGSATHIYGELVKMLTRVSIIHVPYRSTGPALTSLLGGQVQAMFSGVPESIEFIRSGKLRPLAVTMAKRS